MKCFVCSGGGVLIPFFCIIDDCIHHTSVCVPCYSSLRVKNSGKCFMCGEKLDEVTTLCSLHRMGEILLHIKLCNKCLDVI